MIFHSYVKLLEGKYNITRSLEPIELFWYITINHQQNLAVAQSSASIFELCLRQIDGYVPDSSSKSD